MREISAKNIKLYVSWSSSNSSSGLPRKTIELCLNFCMGLFIKRATLNEKATATIIFSTFQEDATSADIWIQEIIVSSILSLVREYFSDFEYGALILESIFIFYDYWITLKVIFLAFISIFFLSNNNQKQPLEVFCKKKCS